MMDKNTINSVLTSHTKVIKESIKKVNINTYALSTRCANLDDIFQEVCIALWGLLKDYYDSDKMDITEFIKYQASWHARRIYSNILKSPRCFTGSKIKKSPKSGSQQGMIDSNKILLSNAVESVDHSHDDYSYIEPLKDFIMENCGMSNNFDMDYDYDYLVKEIRQQLHNKYSKELYKYDEELYIQIFDELLNTDIDFNISDKKVLYIDGRFYKKLAEKYGFKCVDNMRYILNQIKQIIIEVLAEYNK